MNNLDGFRDSLPDLARDIRLNLQNVMQSQTLSPAQTWGVSVASALAVDAPALYRALVADATAAGIEAAVLEDARAAAVLMGMNNIYYRFRHLAGKEVYSQKPARLRMLRVAQPAASKPDFELYCLAVSAINGCESCIRSHEEAVLEGGLSDEHVHDAVRIAATIHGAAVASRLVST